MPFTLPSPSLQLKNIEAEFFFYIVESEIKDIVSLTNFETFLSTFKGSKYEAHSSKLFTVFKFYTDIVLVLTKLKLFINPSLLPSDINHLLN